MTTENQDKKDKIVKLIGELIEDFSIEKLSFIFREITSEFKDNEIKLNEIKLNEIKSDYKFKDFKDNFGDIRQIGTIKLKDDTTFGFFTIETLKELSEKSGKKKQFELAKIILKSYLFDAGFFIFYDNSKNFRFSFVYSIYKGTKRDFSHYKRYSYFIEKGKFYYTFIKTLSELKFEKIEDIINAFSIDKVTDDFFKSFKYALNEVLIKSLKKEEEFKKKHFFSLQLLSRILFIYFLQRKGWLKWKDYVQDKHYLKNLWRKYKEYVAKNIQKENTFYSSWLSSLFFGAFNRKSYLIDKNLPDDIKESFNIMPFLNGGLFSKNELDEIFCEVPDYVFEWLFEPDLNAGDNKKGFLEIFNFTIDESLPIDVEVAVDPEMLGKVYESLIAEEERGDSGIFYTPRTEIDFMCRLALIEYLYNHTSISKTDLIEFVFNPSSIENFEIDKARVIKKYLDKVRIVDPAVGSASFLVGMMNILVELHTELTKKIEQKEENLFALKQKIILENLYGVDVKDWAVMVGELRLWLSLIVETDERYMDIYTKPLLPNLSFKIRQGDSLVEDIGGIQITLRSDSEKHIPNVKIKNKIKLLMDMKKSFFSGQISADKKEFEEIEKLEQDIFSEIIKSKINQI
ncbi:MAG: DNA methyltransferase, partial [bacterium]